MFTRCYASVRTHWQEGRCHREFGCVAEEVFKMLPMNVRWQMSARWIVFALVAALALVLATASLAFARMDPYDGSGVPVKPYAPYTAAEDVAYAPYVTGPVIHEPTPYAPYVTGPVIHESTPYAPYTEAPVVNDTPPAPHATGPTYAPYTDEEEPYAPYETGPVVH
jgi:hypothetical protein